MGAAKKQRTVEYFQKQGQTEIAKLVEEAVAKRKEKQVEQKDLEEKEK